MSYILKRCAAMKKKYLFLDALACKSKFIPKFAS